MALPSLGIIQGPEDRAQRSRRLIPVVQSFKRPVVEDWACRRSGDCCRTVDYVVMTEQEKEAVVAYAEKELPIRRLVQMNWSPGPSSGFVALTAGPCPMLEYVGGLPTCSVHPVRPYNCRRFGCMRPVPKLEPLQMAPLSPVLKYGNIGCVNLRERLLQSRIARRLYAKMQRHAQRWALKHGWSAEMT